MPVGCSTVEGSTKVLKFLAKLSSTAERRYDVGKLVVNVLQYLIVSSITGQMSVDGSTAEAATNS